MLINADMALNSYDPYIKIFNYHALELSEISPEESYQTKIQNLDQYTRTWIWDRLLYPYLYVYPNGIEL